MSSLPLDGIRIIDFTHDWVGPLSTRILADFGAEVIKVEYIKRICAFRGGRLEDKMYNRHPRWHQVNRNKLSITLDLDEENDLQIFKDLVRVSDAVVNNSRPNVLKDHGLSYEELLQIKPDIIVASLSAFGSTGPYSSYAGFGATIEPISGLSGMTAYEKNEKTYRVKEMDVFNGLMSTCAIMTAFIHRQKTGEGQYVDLSQVETSVHGLMGEHLLEFVMNKRQTLPLGNRHHWYAPQGCYRCKGNDKWIAITIRSDKEWETFCHLLGHPEWSTSPQFINRQSRMDNHDTIDRFIEEWTSQYDHHHVMHLLQEKGIPAGAVLDVSQVCNDEHLHERGYFMKATDGSDGLFPGMICKLSKGAGKIRRRGPDLGQHNEMIFCDLLNKPQDCLKPINEDDIGTAYDAVAGKPLREKELLKDGNTPIEGAPLRKSN